MTFMKSLHATPAALLISGLLALSLPTRVAAQESGAITGLAVDAVTYEPLMGARIEVVGQARSANADSLGRFTLPDLPAGELTLRVTHPGYGTVVESFTVTDLEETLIQFPMLPLHMAIDELLVEVQRMEARSGGSAEARVPGDRSGAATAADLLAQRVPGLRVDRPTGAVGAGAAISIRGLGTLQGSNAPAIFLDGIRIDDRETGLRGSREPQALHVLEMIPASDVRQIRVLRGPAASAFYGESASGVIVIETVRGAPTDRSRP